MVFKGLAKVQDRLWYRRGLLGRAGIMVTALMAMITVAASFILIGLSGERSATAQADAVHREQSLEAAYSQSVETTNIALKGFLRTGEPSFLDDYDSYHLAVDAYLIQERRTLPAALAPRLEAVAAAQEAWDSFARQARVDVIGGESLPSPELAASSMPTYQALRDAISDVDRASDVRFDTVLAKQHDGQQTAALATLAGVTGGFAGLGLLAWAFYASTIVPLRTLITAANGLAAGREVAIPALKSGGEVGRLSVALASWAAAARDRQEMGDRMSELVDELRLANTELASASRHKSEFLATMSHELRTPLNSILGFAQLLQVSDFGQLTARQARYVENIRGSGTHLLSLINDVLDLTKVESGRLTLQSEAVSISDCFEQVLAKLRPLAESKGIGVEAASAPRLAVHADARRLQQVLLNLVSNAIKFTPEGGSISLAAEPAGEDARISVSDTGVGIPAGQLDTIFERFVQLGSGRTRNQEGTGLGLTLSRDLAELMGGSLNAESSFGKGSTFTLTLPASAARLLPAEGAAAAAS